MILRSTIPDRQNAIPNSFFIFIFSLNTIIPMITNPTVIIDDTRAEENVSFPPALYNNKYPSSIPTIGTASKTL
ncbi:MAG: hypothetical protein WC679_13450 [Bacteroidales bacterium]